MVRAVMTDNTARIQVASVLSRGDFLWQIKSKVSYTSTSNAYLGEVNDPTKPLIYGKTNNDFTKIYKVITYNC